MQDRNLFEDYLKRKNWHNAKEWIVKELNFLEGRVVFSRTILHVCGFLLSVVLAFYTWLAYTPMASEKEMKAFPLLGLSNKLYDYLCGVAPGGEATVFFSLPLIPVVLGLLTGLILCRMKSKKYSVTPSGTQHGAAKALEDHIETLKKTWEKFFSPGLPLAYTLLGTFLSGGIMLFSSTAGGLNPFGYIIVVVVIFFIHLIAHMLCLALFSRIFKGERFREYPIYDWKEILCDAIDEYESKNGTKKPSTYEPVYHNLEQSEYYKAKYDEYYAMYMGQPRTTETEDERIRRIAREVSEELTGDGSYGDCY